MYSYLRRAAIDNVFVAEIFFDPQTHVERGVAFDVVVNGLHSALVDGYRDFSIKGSLIMCFLRHLSEEAAMETLEQARPHLDKIVGVGLDSGELGNPPKKFERVYKMATDLGLKPVAHAGEEAGPDYIWEALDVLHAKRIDHGVQCLKDPRLVERLVTEQVPLTVCPLSNQKLQVYSRGRNITKELLDKGLKVTINSDDPAYFGGYITENFLNAASETGLTVKDVYAICRNAFSSTFLPQIEKEYYLRELEHFNTALGCVAPPRSISIFGSRSPQPGSEPYEIAREAAKLFASRGFRVVNGGYSGIMEAASQGAAEGGTSRDVTKATSVAKRAKLEEDGFSSVVQGVLAPAVFSQQRNPLGNDFLTHRVIARDIHLRTRSLSHASEYFLIFGGTIGTITELMSVWFDAALRPVYGGTPHRIFLWRPYWEKPLLDFTTATKVHSEDVALLEFVDSAEEALELIEKDLEERAKAASCDV